jgi:hypothetical protein
VPGTHLEHHVDYFCSYRICGARPHSDPALGPKSLPCHPRSEFTGDAWCSGAQRASKTLDAVGYLPIVSWDPRFVPSDSKSEDLIISFFLSSSTQQPHMKSVVVQPASEKSVYARLSRVLIATRALWRQRRLGRKF